MQSDGTAGTVEVLRGKVRCSGAEALWNEYLRRAPDEGVGSGAAVDVEAGLVAARRSGLQPRLGECSADDSSGAFAVREAK